jgi:hypothetical protein
MGLFDQVLGGASAQTAGGQGVSPLTTALIGLSAYRTFQGKGRLAEMLAARSRVTPGLRYLGRRSSSSQPGRGVRRRAQRSSWRRRS